MKAHKPVRSYYEILQVDPADDWGTIKRSYNKLALKYHPDRRKAGDKWAEAQFLAIQQAYEVMKDDAARKKYDKDMGFNLPKVKVHDWGASAKGAYGDTREMLDMSMNDQLHAGEEVKAVFGGNKPWVYVNHGACHVQDKDHWSNGTVDSENPDGTYKIFWPEWQNYSDNVERGKIRKAGETEEDAQMAQKRHERRMANKECMAQWTDGKWYKGFLANVNEDNTYDIFWPEFKNTTTHLARHKIKFQHQLKAAENRDTYTKFFQTGKVELFPNWDVMKLGDVLSDVQRDIIEGEKLYKRLKNMKPDAQRSTYFLIEEMRWETYKLKEVIGIEKFSANLESFDTSNPRGWNEDELIRWIEEKFTKPTIIRKLTAYAQKVNASTFFMNLQKPEQIKKVGIKLKSMQKKVLAATKGMNLTVW